MNSVIGAELYANPLASATDLAGFRTEGQATISFPHGRMRLAHARDPAEGQRANFVVWCPETFPPDVAISWDFLPVQEPGLCILFFAAAGTRDRDLFDPELSARTGEYPQYHSGDINAFHISYFRRMRPEGRALHTCNLRKSHGFHLVAQGANPIPGIADVIGPYHMRIVRYGREITFLINDLLIFSWHDDGATYGPLLAGGKIGFRHQGGLVAEYSNLSIHTVKGDADVDKD